MSDIGVLRVFLSGYEASNLEVSIKTPGEIIFLLNLSNDNKDVPLNR